MGALHDRFTLIRYDQRGFGDSPDPAGEYSARHLAQFDVVDAASERGGLGAANEVELRMWVDGVGRAPRDVDPAVRAAFAGMNLAALEREGRASAAARRSSPPSSRGRRSGGWPTCGRRRSWSPASWISRASPRGPRRSPPAGPKPSARAIALSASPGPALCSGSLAGL